MAAGGAGQLDLKAEAAQEAQEEQKPRLTPEQQAGEKLAWAVGALIIIVTVLILGDWIAMNASLPDLPKSIVEATTPQEVTTAQTQLENYATLRDAEQIRSARMFDV